MLKKTGWIGKNEGLLVYDRNQDGIINNGTELFGDQTILKDNKTLAASGFQALAEFDDNNDGVIDHKDAIFTKLKIWQDTNSNGISEAGELKHLADIGIASIGLSYINRNITDSANNIQVRSGNVTLTDGRQVTVGEYLFSRDASVSYETDAFAISDEVLALPNLAGAGNVKSLHKAMMDDAELLTKVQSFTNDREGNLLEKFEEILFKWTGADAIEQGSRGTLVDAKKLAVLEKMFAIDYRENGAANPTQNATADSIHRVYSDLLHSLFAKVMMKTHIKDLFELTGTSQAVENIDFSTIANNVITKVVEKVNTNASDTLETLKNLSIVLKSYNLSTDKEFNKLWEFLVTKENSNEYILAFGYANAAVKIANSGNDFIYSNSSRNAQLFGQDGNDSLYGHNGDDILDGGTGNDTLYLSKGNDIFVFKRGYGKDVIKQIIGNHITKDNQDQVIFGEDIKPEEVMVRRSGNSLILSIKDTDDSLTIEDYFSSYNQSTRIKQFKFADTTWTDEDIAEKARYIYGTDQGEAIHGYTDQANIIFANSGNDTLYSNSTHGSQLFGQDGNDSLYGHNGDDILDGGTGNDTLYLSKGNDIFVFKRGYGKDVIKQIIGNHITKDNQDQVIFGEDIKPEEVMVEIKNNYAIFRIDKTTDELKIESWSQTSKIFSKFQAGDRYITSENLPKMISALNEFATDNGFGNWQDAIQDKPDEYRQIVDGFWVDK